MNARVERYSAGRYWFALSPEIIKQTREQSPIGLRERDIETIIKSLPEVRGAIPAGTVTDLSTGVFLFLQQFHRLNNKGFSFYLESPESPGVLNKKLKEVLHGYKDIVNKMFLIYETILQGDFNLCKRNIRDYKKEYTG